MSGILCDQVGVGSDRVKSGHNQFRVEVRFRVGSGRVGLSWVTVNFMFRVESDRVELAPVEQGHTHFRVGMGQIRFCV